MPELKKQAPDTFKTKNGVVLSGKEHNFCKQYVYLLGNATQAVIDSYEVDKSKQNWKNTASAIGSENLRKPHILECIRYYLDIELNEDTVNAELAFLVKQNDNLNAKKGAIELYKREKGLFEKDNSQRNITVELQQL